MEESLREKMIFVKGDEETRSEVRERIANSGKWNVISCRDAVEIYIKRRYCLMNPGQRIRNMTQQ